MERMSVKELAEILARVAKDYPDAYVELSLPSTDESDTAGNYHGRLRAVDAHHEVGGITCVTLTGDPDL
jgi:hypothetical protein